MTIPGGDYLSGIVPELTRPGEYIDKARLMINHERNGKKDQFQVSRPRKIVRGKNAGCFKLGTPCIL
jgi:hypothetical protein